MNKKRERERESYTKDRKGKERQTRRHNQINKNYIEFKTNQTKCHLKTI